MKNLFLLLLYSTFSFGQKADQNNFSIFQIDSITNVNNKYGSSDSVIKVKNKNGKVIGDGGSSISTYLFLPYKPQFDKLSKAERKKFNVNKDAKLIKGTYHRAIHYKDYTENIYIQNYYNGTELFFVKIKISRKAEGNEEEILEYNLDKSALNDDKVIKNEFLLDIKNIVTDTNEEILKFHRN